MYIERAQGLQKGRFSEVYFEDINEITIAHEAAWRAIGRTRGYNTRRYLLPEYYLDEYVARPLVNGWNRAIEVVQRDIRPLYQASNSLYDVIQATHIDRAAYAEFFEDEGAVSTADHYRVAIWQGRQPDAMVRAISAYHEPGKSGKEYTNDWLVSKDTLTQMVGAAFIALHELDPQAFEIAADNQ